MTLVSRLTSQLSSRGVKGAQGMAIGLLRKHGSLNKHGKLTSYGKKRQALGKAGRAKSRAAKYSGNKPSDYKYNSKTNMAVKK